MEDPARRFSRGNKKSVCPYHRSLVLVLTLVDREPKTRNGAREWNPCLPAKCLRTPDPTKTFFCGSTGSCLPPGSSIRRNDLSARQGHISYHVSSAGPEAIQAVAAALLRPGDDWFYPYYRDRTLALGLGVAAKDIFLQGMTKGADTSFQGRHMPFRFGSKELKIVSRSSVNGAQFLQAVETAGAVVVARDRGEPSLSPSAQADEIVFVSGGEESMRQIAFYEAVTAATLRRLTVLFLIEDDGYSTRMRV